MQPQGCHWQSPLASRTGKVRLARAHHTIRPCSLRLVGAILKRFQLRTAPAAERATPEPQKSLASLAWLAEWIGLELLLSDVLTQTCSCSGLWAKA